MATDGQAPARPNPEEPRFMDEWDLEPKWLRLFSGLACPLATSGSTASPDGRTPFRFQPDAVTGALQHLTRVRFEIGVSRGEVTSRSNPNLGLVNPPNPQNPHPKLPQKPSPNHPTPQDPRGDFGGRFTNPSLGLRRRARKCRCFATREVSVAPWPSSGSSACGGQRHQRR